MITILIAAEGTAEGKTIIILIEKVKGLKEHNRYSAPRLKQAIFWEPRGVQFSKNYLFSPDGVGYYWLV
jgi:hypothetical protein